MTLRIDFGRLFPGIVIFVVGALLFVLWLILVFVSFFAFFVPVLHGVFYLALDILVASLVLMACGGALMLAGVSGWIQFGERKGRMGRYAADRADKDTMRAGERGGEVFNVLVSFLVLLFFAENQVRHTGFFTPAFSSTEQVLFYGTWAASLFDALARAAYGRRNAVRPLDAIVGGLLGVTALSLLWSFPFDFHHLPDLVPAALRFLVSWISNTIARVALAVIAVGGFALMLYSIVVFGVVTARQRFSALWSGP